MSKKVVAILCADIHLSHQPPVARSAEPDWYAAMRRPLDELARLGNEHSVPILCAGDVFDKWQSPPELINFAMDHLPTMYAVPGQHDLPNHCLGEIERSAYQTLVKYGKIISVGRIKNAESFLLSGFPWSVEVAPPEKRRERCLHIALVHAFIWSAKENGYPGAGVSRSIGGYQDKLVGFETAVFGDNHIGFSSETGEGTTIFNCGSLIRRKIDEISYRPQVGLLYEDGTVTPHFLDTSEDKFIQVNRLDTEANQLMDMSRFIKELGSLGSDALDFRDQVNRYLDDIKASPGVRDAVSKAIG